MIWMYVVQENTWKLHIIGLVQRRNTCTGFPPVSANIPSFCCWPGWPFKSHKDEISSKWKQGPKNFQFSSEKKMLPPLFHGHTMMVNHSISSVLGPISSSKALINPHTLRHRPWTCCCLDHLSCIPGLGVERSAAHGHIQKCSFSGSFCSTANLKNQLCLILKCSVSKTSLVLTSGHFIPRHQGFIKDLSFKLAKVQRKWPLPELIGASPCSRTDSKI